MLFPGRSCGLALGDRVHVRRVLAEVDGPVDQPVLAVLDRPPHGPPGPAVRLEDRRGPVGRDPAVVLEDRHDLAPGAADPAVPQPGDRLPLGLDQHDRRPVVAEPLADLAPERLHHDHLHPVALGLRVERPQRRLQHVPAVDRRHHDRQLGRRPTRIVDRDGVEARSSIGASFPCCDDGVPSPRTSGDWHPTGPPPAGQPQLAGSTRTCTGHSSTVDAAYFLDLAISPITLRLPRYSPVWYHFCLDGAIRPDPVGSGSRWGRRSGGT